MKEWYSLRAKPWKEVRLFLPVTGLEKTMWHNSGQWDMKKMCCPGLLGKFSSFWDCKNCPTHMEGTLVSNCYGNKLPPTGWLKTMQISVLKFQRSEASFSCYLAMAPHSSTLAWRLPWTEERGRLQSMGSLRVGHDWATDFTFNFHLHALEKEMATHSSVLAWRIPGTGEPVGLPSMGSHRVGHDWSDSAAAVAARWLAGLCFLWRLQERTYFLSLLFF